MESPQVVQLKEEENRYCADCDAKGFRVRAERVVYFLGALGARPEKRPAPLSHRSSRRSS